MTPVDILAALHRNGVIYERARRNGRSLDSIERNIIWSGRKFAAEHGHSIKMINLTEMEGEHDYKLIMTSVLVKARFAYYHDPYGENPAVASYLITKSNHPGFPAGGNVDAKQLIDAGMKIPKTPTYDKWVKQGRPCYRGVQS